MELKKVWRSLNLTTECYETEKACRDLHPLGSSHFWPMPQCFLCWVGKKACSCVSCPPSSLFNIPSPYEETFYDLRRCLALLSQVNQSTWILKSTLSSFPPWLCSITLSPPWYLQFLLLPWLPFPTACRHAHTRAWEALPRYPATRPLLFPSKTLDQMPPTLRFL